MSATFWIGAAAVVLFILVLLVSLLVIIRGLRTDIAALRAEVARHGERTERSAVEVERRIHDQESEHSRQLAALADYLIETLRPVRGTLPPRKGRG